MRLDVVNLRGIAPPTSSSAASPLAEWRVGAVLQAVATRDPGNGQLFLNMGGQRYPARLASGNGDENGPVDGERMALRVLRNSPVLALERIADSSRSNVDNKAIGDALRKFVPRQASPAPLLSNLAWVARGGAESLPKTIAQVADRLWQAMPTTDDMSDPMKLERALGRSGAFLEAALANDDGTPAARNAVASDLKTLMLQFARVLHEHGARPNGATFADTSAHAPLPSAGGPLNSLASSPATLALLDTPLQQMNELARQTDGALARLTATQVTNSAQDTPTPAILIEVPVKQDDRASMLRVRIEQEQSKRSHEGSEAWTVEAALDLGAVGALHARVSLSGRSFAPATAALGLLPSGLRVGVQLRADSPAVVEMLNARAPELEAMLRDAGLEVDRIVCRHGMPAGDAGQRLTRLLDVRA